VVSWRVETAPSVIAKVHKPGKAHPDPLRGIYEANIGGKKCTVEYEPETDPRDTEQEPLLETGGVEAFLRREVLALEKETEGLLSDFHSYTMKQAIREGFILDVLKSYTPVDSYYKPVKTVESDPEFDTKRAKKKLRR
jgi:hypothetical protein